jgi:glutathione S-transferase
VEVYNRNPLGKVPVLIRPDQPPLFDSDVICAYLDDLHDGQKLVPALGELRWRALCLQAVAQGLADTGIRLRWETVRRPKAFRYQPLADGYRRKLMTTYDWLETNIGEHDPLHIGHIAIATTLSWLKFRDLADFTIVDLSFLAGSLPLNSEFPCWQHHCPVRPWMRPPVNQA